MCRSLLHVCPHALKSMWTGTPDSTHFAVHILLPLPPVRQPFVVGCPLPSVDHSLVGIGLFIPKV